MKPETPVISPSSNCIRSTHYRKEVLEQHGLPHAANDNITNDISHGDRIVMERGVADGFEKILRELLIDTEGDHNTRNTAARVAKMYCREVFRGRYEPAPIVTTFPNTKKLDELVMTGPITVRSTCSHHFCPILGQAWIGVIYDKQLAGLSKFNRVVEWIAARPQIQEEMVVQVADFVDKVLKPKGLGIVMTCQHTCMTWRGVKEHSSALMTTSVMRGVFRKKPEARAEFMATLALHR